MFMSNITVHGKVSHPYNYLYQHVTASNEDK